MDGGKSPGDGRGWTGKSPYILQRSKALGYGDKIEIMGYILATLYSITLYSITLYSITLYSITLYSITLYYITLYSITLYYITLHEYKRAGGEVNIIYSLYLICFVLNFYLIFFISTFILISIFIIIFIFIIHIFNKLKFFHNLFTRTFF